MAFWPTKEQAQADALRQIASKIPEVVITKSESRYTYSDGSDDFDVERMFQHPLVLHFVPEGPERKE